MLNYMNVLMAKLYFIPKLLKKFNHILTQNFKEIPDGLQHNRQLINSTRLPLEHQMDV